jgi:hypothetical protein
MGQTGGQREAHPFITKKWPSRCSGRSLHLEDITTLPGFKLQLRRNQSNINSARTSTTYHANLKLVENMKLIATIAAICAIALTAPTNPQDITATDTLLFHNTTTGDLSERNWFAMNYDDASRVLDCEARGNGWQVVCCMGDNWSKSHWNGNCRAVGDRNGQMACTDKHRGDGPYCCQYVDVHGAGAHGNCERVW